MFTIKRQNEIPINDINLASTLLTMGFQVIKPVETVISKGGEKWFFYFENTEEVNKCINEYLNMSDSIFGIISSVFDMRKNILKDIKEKSNKLLAYEKNGSHLLVSEKVDKGDVEKLVKRM